MRTTVPPAFIMAFAGAEGPHTIRFRPTDEWDEHHTDGGNVRFPPTQILLLGCFDPIAAASQVITAEFSIRY